MYWKLLFMVINLIKLAMSVCPETITNQGYKCCSDGCTVIYTDINGDWSIENNEWCGCGDSDRVVNVNFEDGCDPNMLTMDYHYQCCNHCVVSYTDETGEWGVMNNEWCAISKKCRKDEQKQQYESFKINVYQEFRQNIVYDQY